MSLLGDHKRLASVSGPRIAATRHTRDGQALATGTHNCDTRHDGCGVWQRRETGEEWAASSENSRSSLPPARRWRADSAFVIGMKGHNPPWPGSQAMKVPCCLSLQRIVLSTSV